MASTSTAAAAQDDNPVIATRKGAVQILTLNRPKALNALSASLVKQLNAHLDAAQADPAVRAIVITGGDKLFAVGSDIKELKDRTFTQAYTQGFSEAWHISRTSKPLIGAVSGYALGGGCELAMACDILICSPEAVFGQPEITLGTIPGAGGTQRLTRAVGKAMTMDMILTGRRLSAEEALAYGIVSRITKRGESVSDQAVKIAENIASLGVIAVTACKEAVNASEDLSLAEGLRFERRLFHSLFGTADQKEGMAAFAEKRKARFSHL